MNIRYYLQFAEKCLNEGSVEAAEGWVNFVEEYLRSTDPDGNLEAPTICYFWTKGDIIHCGKTNEDLLFPGTREERFKLCKECRDWCREKIKELKIRIEEKKEMEKFKEEFFSKKTPPGGMYLPPWVRK